MNVICISLRRNMKCGCKISDVARNPQKRCSSDFQELKLQNEFTNPPNFRHHYNRNRFLELGMGDPSRNIIEMIYRASSANPRKCRRKIKKVIKVKNTVDVLVKFEKYRERVMVTSCNEDEEHPRSVVDGNEALLFYGTTMNCCCAKHEPAVVVSEVCSDPSCRVCRVIQSGFNTSYNKINGIRLSRKSENMSEEVHKGGKKAVIICRAIAGMEDGRFQQDQFYESGFCRKSSDESMILRNPAAVLPCFVIVF